MTFLNTNQLEGITLDRAVARAQGWCEHDATWAKTTALGGAEVVTLVNRYRPSINWVQAAPIIEAYVRELVYHNSQGDSDCFWSCKVDLHHNNPHNGLPSYRATGPTALIAAMRAFVGYHLGYAIQAGTL